MKILGSLAAVLAVVLGCIIVAVIALVLGFPVTSFTMAGAPSSAKLKPVIEAAWLRNLSQNSRRHVSTTVSYQKIGQARWGQDVNGKKATFWPVKVNLETTCREVLTLPQKGKSLSMQEILDGKSQAPPPELETFSKEVDTRECYARPSGDNWVVTFEKPADVTPWYKFW